jgi:hypothetical protein
MTVFFAIEASQPYGATYRLAIGGDHSAHTGFDVDRIDAVDLTTKGISETGCPFLILAL